MTSSPRQQPEFELHIGRGWLTAETALVRYVNKNDANGYYKTLGLSPDATREEIKAAYRKLVKKLHPDRGGDEELFRFVVEIANILLDPESKSSYDSVGSDSIFLGAMEQEELARSGVSPSKNSYVGSKTEDNKEPVVRHWACLTTPEFSPGVDTDAWADLCREVSPAVGYRGKIRVGIIEDLPRSWSLFKAGTEAFVVFQRGVEPNRLTALCAMIDWQNHLLNQIRGSTHNRERTTWLLAQEGSQESTREAKSLLLSDRPSVSADSPLSSAGMAGSPQPRMP